MFTKSISIKSNFKLKASDRRRLLASFCTQYGKDLTLLPALLRLTDAYRLKITTSIASSVYVYKFGNDPLLIEDENKLVPTIYLLWLLPDLLPEFKIHESLVNKIASGADLMLPGMIFNHPLKANSYEHLEKNALCCITTATNRAAVAVGRMAMSGRDLFTSSGYGKAVNIYHVIGDHLCSLGASFRRPHLESSSSLDGCFAEVFIKDSGDAALDCPLARTTEQPQLFVDAPPFNEDMDSVFQRRFLLAVKSLSDSQLPMPVSVFYSQHILNQKSKFSPLNIKKTSFKRVGTFLKGMEDDGLISLQQTKPGVYILTSVNREHLSLRDTTPFAQNNTSELISQGNWPPGYFGPPIVEDVFVVNGSTVSIFAQFGFSLNTCITHSESRSAVDNYVRLHGLRRQGDPRSLVQLDELLMKLCDPKCHTEALESTLSKPVYLSRLDDVFSSILKLMSAAYRITFPTKNASPVIWRKLNKRPFIEMSTGTKNGKRITRVINLSIFGIDPDAFAKHLQSTLACSAGRLVDAQFTSDVIQAQGWHSVAVSKILTETYGIKKQFIKGYDEDTKKRK